MRDTRNEFGLAVAALLLGAAVVIGGVPLMGNSFSGEVDESNSPIARKNNKETGMPIDYNGISWVRMDIEPKARWQHSIIYNPFLEKVIMYGGSNKGALNDTWSYSRKSNLWTEFTEAGSPNATRAPVACDPETGITILFGGRPGSNTYLDETWILNPDNNTWVETYPIFSPSPRRYHKMTFDSINNKVIMFGGELSDGSLTDETWAYDIESNNWTKMNPDNKPAARIYHSVCYDENNGKVVLYGGGTSAGGGRQADTWIYDYLNDNWTQMNPSSNPGPRRYHTINYDSVSNMTILFAGDDSGVPDDETWAYNLSADVWINMNPSQHPDERYLHGMTFDTIAGMTIVYGGYNDIDNELADLWAYEYKSNRWYKMGPYNCPSERSECMIAYDDVNNVSIMFGGDDKVDTWAYHTVNNSWKLRNPSGTPTERYQHGMVYLPSQANVIMFGGSDGSSLNNDTWAYEYSSNTWTDLQPSMSPTPRHGFGMVTDTVNDVIILFGGNDGTGYNDETWVYDPSTDNWSNMSPTTSPSERRYHTMAYDRNNQLVLLFGGYNGSYLNDTWAYNYSTNEWIELSPTTAPSARGFHAPGMVYDETNERFILYGGEVGAGSNEDDMWIYEYLTNRWSNVVIGETPSPRKGAPIAIDSTIGQLILFGGYNGSVLNDTWTFKLPNEELVVISDLEEYHPGDYVSIQATFRGHQKNVTFQVDDADGTTIVLESMLSNTMFSTYNDTAATWRFTEGEGQVTSDETENDNDGVLGDSTGTDEHDPTWTYGLCDNALAFDGDDDYVEIADDDDLDSGIMTVSTWIYPHQFASGSPSNDSADHFLSKGQDTIDGSWALGRHAVGEHADKFLFKIRSTDTQDPTPANRIYTKNMYNQTDAWYHLVATYDGNDLNIYVNGELENSTTIGSKSFQNNTESLRIGWHTEGAYRYAFNGIIDETQVYSDALNATEVASLYDSYFDQTAALTFRLPEDATLGTWTAYAFVEDYNLSANCTFDVIALPEPPEPELRIVSVSVPGNVSAGSTLTVDVNVSSTYLVNKSFWMTLQVWDPSETPEPTYLNRTFIRASETRMYYPAVAVPDDAEKGTWRFQVNLLWRLPSEAPPGGSVSRANGNFEVV